MILVHGAVYADRLFVWGESPNEGYKTDKQTKGRAGSKSGLPEPYPFDTGPDGLLNVLSSAILRTKPDRKLFSRLNLWVPVKGAVPISSGPLISDPPASKAKVTLSPRLVTVYGLQLHEAVELLCACRGRQVLAHGTAIGADLAFWAEALRFSGSITARRQYLPSIEQEGDIYRAVWQPVYSGDAGRAADELARRMPSSARALKSAEDPEPPATPAAELLRRFVGLCLDHLVRFSTWTEQPTPRSRKTPDFDSVHDAWMYALKAPDNRIAADGGQLAGLVRQVRDWSRPIAVTASYPFRLCFRLEEPGTEVVKKGKRQEFVHTSWYVRYLMQPLDDLSLLIPVEDAWNPGPAVTTALKTAPTRIREFLLTALGQASAVCPSVASSLEASNPGGYSADVQGAHDFLRERAILLQQAGFTVMLPTWWTGSGTKLRPTVSAIVRSSKMKAKGILSIDSIVEFDWEVAIGGVKLSLRELQELAAMKASLVLFRGRWVEINAEEIQAALKVWKKKGSNTAMLQDVMKMALGAEEGPPGLDFAGVKATGRVGSLLKRLKTGGGMEDLEPDVSFSGKLRPYQLRGLSWMGFLARWGLGACLADDMGLGKTIQTLALIQRFRNSDGCDKPVLLVCPTTVVNNWQKESMRFTPDVQVLIHHGMNRKKGADFKKEAAQSTLVISSYGLLHREIKLFQDVQWSGVILDEAQNIKNSETKQAQAARSLKTGYRIALTG
ncbi:MAG: DEAD/DEAH box helicase, partial [Pseudomonadota bacterium]